MPGHRVTTREWTHQEGSYRHRIRLYQDPTVSSGNICIEIRDWRRPNEYHYRTLSLRHKDRDRAIAHAKVLVRWWKRTGRPPKMVWRSGRGHQVKEAA